MKNKYFKGIIAIVCFFSIMLLVFFLQVKFDNNTGKDLEVEDFKNKKIEEIQTEEKTKNEINSLVNMLFDEKITKEKLGKAIGVLPSEANIFYGEDSFVRSLNNNVSAISKYDTALDEYASDLENIIKSNFNLQMGDYIVSEDGAIVQRVNYRTYYYVDFIKDYSTLCNKILSYTDIDLDNIVEKGAATKTESEIIYKVNVKALEIMSNYFEDYINKDETLSYELIYRKGEKEITNEYFSLFMYLSGALYKECELDDSNRDERINNMIKNAIDDGSLDINNPYNLK